MSKNFFLTSLFLLSGLFASAQQGTVVDDLNKEKSGQGNVNVYQDEAIKNLIGTKGAVQKQDSTASSQTNKTSSSSSALSQSVQTSGTEGRKARVYRIQVFSGNDQRKSKNEASYKRDLIKSRFPQLSANVAYNAPVWRVRVGSFLNRHDAEQALKELRASFPSFGREMYVVQEVMRVSH